MVDTHEIRSACSEIESCAELLRERVDEITEAAESWETIENEGWSDGAEVVGALEQGSEWIDLADKHGVSPDDVDEWLEFADASGLGPEEAKSLVSCKDELEAMVDVFSVAAGRGTDDHEDAQTALETIRGEGKESLSGVTAALKALVVALQDAEILPRTEAVPAASNSTESTNTHSISATNEVEFSPGDSITTNPVHY